jgi:hemerythrin
MKLPQPGSRRRQDMSIPTLRWQAAYDTAIEEIDLQHRYFLALINRLNGELQDCRDAGYRLRLFDEIARYAAFHFVSEENLMIKFGYPALERHQELHRGLLDQLSWRMRAASHETLLEFLLEWFIHHTVEEDRQIGEHVRRRAAPPPQAA